MVSCTENVYFLYSGFLLTFLKWGAGASPTNGLLLLTTVTDKTQRAPRDVVPSSKISIIRILSLLMLALSAVDSTEPQQSTIMIQTMCMNHGRACINLILCMHVHKPAWQLAAALRANLSRSCSDVLFARLQGTDIHQPTCYCQEQPAKCLARGPHIDPG